MRDMHGSPIGLGSHVFDNPLRIAPQSAYRPHQLKRPSRIGPELRSCPSHPLHPLGGARLGGHASHSGHAHRSGPRPPHQCRHHLPLRHRLRRVQPVLVGPVAGTLRPPAPRARLEGAHRASDCSLWVGNDTKSAPSPRRRLWHLGLHSLHGADTHAEGFGHPQYNSPPSSTSFDRSRYSRPAAAGPAPSDGHKAACLTGPENPVESSRAKPLICAEFHNPSS